MKKNLSDLRKNIKIHVIEEGVFKRVVILNTNKFLKYLNCEKNSNLLENLKNKEANNPIVGTICIEKHPKEMNWATISIASEHGYGPLLYEIAMSSIYPHYLSPDDSSRVNDNAKSIWEKFCYRKDIKKIIKTQFQKPFELIEHPALKLDSKYCLFYQYKIKKPINYQKYLIENQYIKKTTDNKIEFEETLSNLASNFFIEKYALPD